MNRIIFIEPKPPNFHIFSKFKSPRLGVFILGSLLKDRGWDVEVFIEDMEKIDWDRIKSADIVGISSITSTAPRAYKIADKIREMGITVIMGGPHPTFLPEEALEHSDYVFRGESEHSLVEFINNWQNKGNFSMVAGLSYRDNDIIIHNPQQTTVPDMDRIPFPDFSLFRGKKKITAPGRVIPIQTSRGCPFNCSFCSVTPMFGRKYRFRSTENIIRELQQYRKGKYFIFFYDDNFTANPDQTKKLMKEMIKEEFKFKWSAQVRADVARDESLIRLMRKAGCKTVFIGFESVNPESLCEMKKNQEVEDIVQAINLYRKCKINIHGMFMLGMDSDNWETVKRTLRFARRHRLTSVQFLILTPLPGTELYERIKSDKRILFDDWSLYDAHHVVFQPANFSSAKLQFAQIYCHNKFYSRLQRIKKLLIGNVSGFFITFYARHLNKIWKRKNRTFLKVLELLKPNRNAQIVINYREKVILNSGKKETKM
jgi:radical SAM superfamily enzyme YgiQ (UPF0313 family)